LPVGLFPFAAVSQPLSFVGAAGFVQFAKPRLQVESQSPPVQLLDATLVPEQARPQPPQLSTVVMSVSQPLSGMGAAGFVQSANPRSHTGTHPPPTHMVLEALAVLHCRLHAPQLALSVLVLTSHPFGACPSQLAKPMLHDITVH